MVEVGRLGAGDLLDDDAGPDLQNDRRSDGTFGRTVDRPRLAGNALRLVMDEMRPGAARLDVRRHAPLSPFGEGGERDRELARDRDNRDERGQPGAAACVVPEAGEHILLWYG